MKNYGGSTRLNTNGMGNVINEIDIVPELKKVIDIVSISLNAPNKERYQEICKCEFGEKSYEYMIDFAKRCIEEGMEVKMSVVDDFLTDEEIAECRKIAENLGATLRVRVYSEKE